MDREEKAALRAQVVEMLVNGESIDKVVEFSRFGRAYIGLIARKAGMTVKHVYVGQYKSDGVRRPKSLSPEQQERAIKMEVLYRDGQTLEQIGAIFGVSKERVRQLISTRGVTRKDGGKSKQKQSRMVLAVEKKEARCLAQYGCSLKQREEIAASRMMSGYSRQRTNAIIRGVEWKITPWEWWCIWRDSGHAKERGRLRDNYVMARLGDAGAYEVGNVEIITASQNSIDRFVHLKTKIVGKAK